MSLTSPKIFKQSGFVISHLAGKELMYRVGGLCCSQFCFTPGRLFSFGISNCPSSIPWCVTESSFSVLLWQKCPEVSSVVKSSLKALVKPVDLWCSGLASLSKLCVVGQFCNCPDRTVLSYNTELGLLSEMWLSSAEMHKNHCLAVVWGWQWFPTTREEEETGILQKHPSMAFHLESLALLGGTDIH